MTPHDFVSKWRGVELKERSASQSHFNDLCALLGLADPITADKDGSWFAFEKGAAKTGGGDGWADVWRKHCFAWEYKGRHANLDKALQQLLRYASALDNPPLLIVSDMDRIRIHTNWTNTVQQTTELTLDDLLDGSKRQLLRNAFTDPEALKPTRTRQQLTEDQAKRFAELAQRLRERGHPAERVAHFVNRLVFCMFAEDAGLLPNKLFTQMLEASRYVPAQFADHASTLFGAMANKGGRVGFTRIDWFNGGLFDDDHALPLARDDIDQLILAAAQDWSQIDPSIMGTLFERGLDPDKRSQLGAHYTDRDKIMMIVEPVIVRPLTTEWEEVRERIVARMAKAPQRTADKLLTPAQRTAQEKARREAQGLLRSYLERLAHFRVLDPACGSGNFLYLSLLSLKDLEHRANIEAEELGLQRELPMVGPQCVLGIELNPYAAELARVSVWIGEIQWMRRHGYEAGRDPILKKLDTIECRDAVLSVIARSEATKQSSGPSGDSLDCFASLAMTQASGPAEWPGADVIVGNPPFLGNKKMIAELGEEYTRALRKAYPHVPGGVDLVCYWFAKAWAMIVAGKARRAGLVATNSIRGGSNREVLKPIVEQGRIFEAWSDEAWTVEGAAVRVSMVCFDREHGGAAELDGAHAPKVLADLSAERGGRDLTSATRLAENKGIAFQGPVKVGPFDVNGKMARLWLTLPTNPNGHRNADVVLPLLNGSDITRRTTDRWIVDFGERSEADAALFEAPFEYVRTHVKPVRDQNRRERRQMFWWQHGETVPGIKMAIRNLSRVILTPRVAKHRLFVWASAGIVPDSRVVIVCKEDNATFGILHSKFHEVWSLALGGWHGVGNDPQYTPSLGFETFPFPEGLTPDIPVTDFAKEPRAQKIGCAAARLNELRENWLNPPDLVRREPEVVAGYPDRILPVSEEAAKELKKRTLTNLYNARPQWLANAHAVLDEAVAEAYGWGDDWRAGLLTDDELLARLFRLNQQRAKNQG